MTDIGVADLSPFAPDAHDHRVDDNIIHLGRSSAVSRVRLAML